MKEIIPAFKQITPDGNILCHCKVHGYIPQDLFYSCSIQNGRRYCKSCHKRNMTIHRASSPAHKFLSNLRSKLRRNGKGALGRAYEITDVYYIFSKSGVNIDDAAGYKITMCDPHLEWVPDNIKLVLKKQGTSPP